MKKIAAVVVVLVACFVLVGSARADGLDFFEGALFAGSLESLQKLADRTNVELEIKTIGSNKQISIKSIQINDINIEAEDGKTLVMVTPRLIDSKDRGYECFTWFPKDQELVSKIKNALTDRYGYPKESELQSGEIGNFWNFSNASILLSDGSLLYGKPSFEKKNLPPLPVSDSKSSTPASPASAYDEPFSIRNDIKWGMSKQEVIALEGATPKINNEKDIMFANVKAGGLDAVVHYAFNDSGALFQVMYQVIEEHVSKNAYIEDFKKLKKALSEKYGAPTIDAETWFRDLYKDDPENYGLAVSIGDLGYFAQYQTSDTKTSLMLMGDNYKITLALDYKSRSVPPPSETPDNSL